MKKNTLLLALLIVSSLGFSQDKSNIDDAFLRRFPSISQPLINLENITLIDKTNTLEREYLNLKAKEVQSEFANQDLSKLKTKDEVFKAYIAYLKKKISEEEKELKKQGELNANRYDFETGSKMKTKRLEKSKINNTTPKKH